MRRVAGRGRSAHWDEPSRRLRIAARNLGLYLRDNPAVLAQTIAGEGLSYPPCYCEACNESFREHLHQRYGTIGRLNEVWKTGFQDWSEVQQLGSPQDLDETAERSGFPVEFIHDDTFDRLKGKKALVVPWCHLMRKSSLEQILAFAQSGGRVILDGPVGLYDESYQPMQPLPGGKLAETLGVGFTDYKDQPNRLRLREGVELQSQGIAVEPRVTKGKILLQDTEGRPALVEVPLGKGQVLVFLTNLGRRHLSCNPDPNAVALGQSLLETKGGLKSRYRFVGKEKNAASLVDVSVRIKGNNELFVFVVSFFEPAEGELEILLPPGRYTARDALSDEFLPLIGNGSGGPFLRLNLPAFGSKVVRIKAHQGYPFSNW